MRTPHFTPERGSSEKKEDNKIFYESSSNAFKPTKKENPYTNFFNDSNSRIISKLRESFSRERRQSSKERKWKYIESDSEIKSENS